MKILNGTILKKVLIGAGVLVAAGAGALLLVDKKEESGIISEDQIIDYPQGENSNLEDEA